MPNTISKRKILSWKGKYFDEMLTTSFEIANTFTKCQILSRKGQYFHEMPNTSLLHRNGKYFGVQNEQLKIIY